MKIYKIGDKSRAICSFCEDLVETEFLLRDVPMHDNSGVVKDVMAGVCTKCQNVVSIPHQSTPQIKNFVRAKKSPIECRVPAHIVDILNLASMEVGGESKFSQMILKFYLHELAKLKFPERKFRPRKFATEYF